MKSCGRDSERSFGENLAFDMFKIDFKRLSLLELVDVFVSCDIWDFFSLAEIFHDVLKMLDRVNGNIGNIFQFKEVFFGDEELFSASFFGG